MTGTTSRLRQPESWTQQAACADKWDLFYGPDGAEVTAAQEEAARRVCAGCEAISSCDAYATAHDEKHGVWAAVNRERQRHGKRSTLQGSRVPLPGDEGEAELRLPLADEAAGGRPDVLGA